MGLSSKQVSSDVLDWSQDLLKDGGLEFPIPAGEAGNQQQRQHVPPVKCPRCDSTNTKFCYYNNYSRSQPRHFCKGCRRHWTNGGTLRNVPVGGTRKNKRPKTTTNATAAATATNNNNRNSINKNMIIQQQHQPMHVPFEGDHQSSFWRLLHPSPPPSDYGVDSSFMGSMPSLLPFSTQFTSTTPAIISSLDNIINNPFSISSSSCSSSVADDGFTSINGSTASTWQAAPTLNSSSSFWSCWDDITGFLTPELKHPTPEDSQIP